MENCMEYDFLNSYFFPVRDFKGLMQSAQATALGVDTDSTVSFLCNI